MGLNQFRSPAPPVRKQRIPVPPAATRFDAVFVHAVADLSAILRSATVVSAAADPEPA